MLQPLPLNLRSYCGHTQGYYSINREERSLAAIFYRVLLLGQNLENLERSKALIGCNHPTIMKEMGIYFEYAYLSDLWNSIEKSNPGN